jgi:hypothetical protein
MELLWLLSFKQKLQKLPEDRPQITIIMLVLGSSGLALQWVSATYSAGKFQSRISTKQ